MGLSVRRIDPPRLARRGAAVAHPADGDTAQRILVVGAGPGIASVRERQAQIGSATGVAVLASDASAVPKGWQHLGPIGLLADHLDAGGFGEVVLCLEDGSWHLADSIVRLSMTYGVPTTIEIPDRSPRAPGRLQRGMKRVVDVAGAITGLVLLAPILVSAALAIRVRDGSPVMFRQHRAGHSGRPFEILKFRTMVRNADSQRAELRDSSAVAGGASFKMDQDPRVTVVGRWLRKTSIDELPQLWNVLRGEMSLVGPRPHPYDDLGGYRPWHLRRLEVKPGITGLWQVELRNDPDFDRWVEKDIEYIDRWSIWLDASILIRTIPSVVRGDGR